MSRSSAAAPRRARPGRGARRRPRRSRPGSRRARPAPPRVGSAGNGCSRLPPNRTTAIALPQIAHDRNTNRHRTRPAVPAGPARSPSVASRPAGIVPAPMLLDGRREREQPCRHRPDAVVHLDRVGVRAARPTWCAASTWTVELDERWVVLGPKRAPGRRPCSTRRRPAAPDRGRSTCSASGWAAPTCSSCAPNRAGHAPRWPSGCRRGEGAGRRGHRRVRRDGSLPRAVRRDGHGPAAARQSASRLAERKFGTLSEGERKRVQIARALMTDPEVLLLDEPAAGLDLGGREDLVGRLSELADDPGAPALVLVTHHVEEIPPGFTHGLLLRGRQSSPRALDEVSRPRTCRRRSAGPGAAPGRRAVLRPSPARTPDR